MKSAARRSPGTATTLLPMLFRSAGVVAVLSLPLLSGVPAAVQAPPADRPEAVHGRTLWKDTWSERYPGCVAGVLWPAGEQPVAAVVRTADGRIDRVDLDPGSPLSTTSDGSETLGLCR